MRPALAIGIMMGALLPGPARAQIIAAVGEIDVVRPPASVGIGVTSYERLIAFEEGTAPEGDVIALDFVGEGLFADGAGDPLCGHSVIGPVNSHYIVRDDTGPAGRKNGLVVFNGRVLGFMTSDDCFLPSDIPPLGAPLTTYPGPGETRGMGLSASEGDTVAVLPGGRGVHVRMNNRSGSHESDHLRVLTQPPAAGPAELVLECSGPEDAGVGLVEYVFALTNEGPDTAILPAVVVLPSASLTYDSVNGGFDCVQADGSRALVCERGDDQPPETREFRIRFSLPDGARNGLSAIATSDLADENPGNNSCTAGGGPLAGSDGGVPGRDGGVPGADSGAGRVDTGPPTSTGGGAPPVGFTFNGGGGCRCGVAGEPGGTAGGLALVALATVVAGRRRRRS